MTDERNFEIIVDTELPGTLERVWEAVTAGTLLTPAAPDGSYGAALGSTR